MANYDGQNPYYGGGGGGGSSPVVLPTARKSPPAKGNATIRPVTIKQVLGASQVHQDSDFQIDGHDINQIMLVGSVHNHTASATNVSYEIGDGTGYVDVRLWLDSADDEAGKMSGIEQDKYVCILGTIKSFNNKRHVSATHIRPITDHNEVYHHFLKALYVSLSLRNPGGAIAPGPRAEGGDYAAPAANGGPDSSAWAHLPPLHKKIMEVVSREDSDDGMHVSSLTRAVSSGSGEDAMEAIEYLMGEGLLFSTIDDLHVKAV
ncbi:replication factor A protein 2 [Saitozyma podzolica]|uniref:Replication factor A protein 2 n=1 Tax=Saitozyma podzolica TaxID=1890683 RepID=A0A427YIP0_9TREE|nr:replication factor A protein 2 [Saitozyma podzolica]